MDTGHSSLTKDLKIIYFNANGLARQADELAVLLHELDIDVALIGETKLMPHKIIKIRNYCIYRKETRAPYGGVAIIIKSRLPHSYKELFTLTNIEIVTIELQINNKPVIIGSVYHSPSADTDYEEYKQLFNIDQDYIYAGDFNAKHVSWNCRLTNNRGKI